MYASVWASGGSPSWDSTHYNLEIGRWTHIALTRLTTTWKFYVDGEQIGSNGTFAVPSAWSTMASEYDGSDWEGNDTNHDICYLKTWGGTSYWELARRYVIFDECHRNIPLSFYSDRFYNTPLETYTDLEDTIGTRDWSGYGSLETVDNPILLPVPPTNTNVLFSDTFYTDDPIGYTWVWADGAYKVQHVGPDASTAAQAVDGGYSSWAASFPHLSVLGNVRLRDRVLPWLLRVRDEWAPSG